MKRPVHNTNSPNFIKLDYQDMCNILTICDEWGLDNLTDDELVTYERVRRIKEIQDDARERATRKGKPDFDSTGIEKTTGKKPGQLG